jgi:hypothetical protein
MQSLGHGYYPEGNGDLIDSFGSLAGARWTDVYDLGPDTFQDRPCSEDRLI